jgi:hypothetical protein
VTFHSPGALAAIAGVAVLVASCASVIEGRTQQIAINTNPPGAECGLYREEGVRIASIQSTPGRALIEKTKADMWIVCVKQGYDQATYYNKSGVAGAAFVNVIGGVFTLGIATVIGAAVDSANGSDNIYQSPVNISMAPNAAGGSASLPQSYDAPKPIYKGQQQVAAASSSAASSPATSPSAGTPAAASPDTAPPAAQAAAAAPVASAAVAVAVEPGKWVCVFSRGGKSDSTYTVTFQVAADHAINVTSYGNAPATIVSSPPLTFTAVNPRTRPRTITFAWSPDNSMVISGESIDNPSASFEHRGRCVKL